jgi:uncharacterized iron-regulated membrane protein
MKPGFRPSMTWLHDWSGLVIGWLLLVIALAGSLSLFREEIGNWARPEVARTTVDPVSATQAAVGWLSAHAMRSPAWYLQPVDGRASTTQAIWQQGGSYVTRALDPRTGSPDGIRDTLGGDVFYRLHFELELPYPWGRILSGSAAMLMVLAILTGIVAHRRFFADFFTFRPHKGQRSWLDAHNLLGVAALPFHLLIAFTGAITLANLLMPWGAMAGYQGDMAAIRHDLYPAEVTPALTHQPAPLVPIAPLMREAERRFGGPVGQIAVINPGDRAAVVTMTRGNAERIAIQSHAISFDGATGRVLAEHIERRPVMTGFNLMYGLHIGRFGDGLARWLYFVSGLMLAGVIGTGLILWTVKRRVRQPGLGFALVERLNIGFVAGTPTAFAAFFLANRLLPVTLAARQDAEARALFWTWGVLLVFAALRRPDRAWRELLALAAAACAAIPAVDWLGGTARWDATELGVTLVALGLAICFVEAARKAARSPAPARVRQQALAA